MRLETGECRVHTGPYPERLKALLLESSVVSRHHSQALSMFSHDGIYTYPETAMQPHFFKRMSTPTPTPF